MADNALHQLKEYDEARSGFPGEHWLVLTAAVALWLSTRRHPAFVVRLLGSVAGTALVARAATGRKVPARLRRWLPYQR